MIKQNIGLIGLAVMGENLVMNMASKGFTVAVYNRSIDKVKHFVEGRAKGKNIVGAYSIEELANLLLDPFFTSKIHAAQAGWRRVIAAAVLGGLAVPAFATALAYYDGYRSERLPANLLQAQRDYFGAHTYERIDQPRGKFFHTNWTGEGGDTASSTYDV